VETKSVYKVYHIRKILWFAVLVFFLIFSSVPAVTNGSSSVGCFRLVRNSTYALSGALNVSMWVNNGSNWVESIEKPVGTDLEFKVEVTEATGVYLIVTVVLPALLEYTGEADPLPMNVTSNEYGSKNLYWYYATGGGSRTFYYHARIQETGTSDSLAVGVLLSPEQSDSDTVQVTGLPSDLPPTADAGGEYSGEPGDEIHFNGTGSYDNDDEGCCIVRYDWKFYDEDIWHNDTGSTPTYVYNTGGDYTVTLRVYDDEGDTASDTALVYVYEGLTAIAGGPYSGAAGELISFSGSVLGGSSPYTFAWDLDNDGEYDDASGASASKSWDIPGEYIISLKVTDSMQESDTDDATVTVFSNPPEKPDTPDGPTSGKAGVEYTYTSSTSDPNGDHVYYKWDWGDSTDSGWLGPYNSGQTVNASHKWIGQDSYQIKVKAKDDPNGDGDLSDGSESDWSDPLSISMPKNKAINPLFLQFLERLMERFPRLARLLNLPVSTNQ